jgi:sensor histidine kinase YesM
MGARVPEAAKFGFFFMVSSVALGPALILLLTWCALDFEWSPALWNDYLINLVHFASYGSLFYPAIAWMRSGRKVSIWGKGSGYLLLSAAGSLIATLVLEFTGLGKGENFVSGFLRSLLVGTVLSAIVLLIEQLYFRLYKVQFENQRMLLDRERERRAAAEARWTSLESRMRPHFLFNTLASIRELMHCDLHRADQMIQRFAELLRFSLDANHAAMVPLEEELRMVSAYLLIEQMRLGERLAWSVETEPALAGNKVPTLSVLTIVENAVKHSVAPRRAGGFVTVRAAGEQALVRITVKDDGPGFSTQDIRPGHGLDLLRERMDLLYGARAELRIVRLPVGVSVELWLPGPSPEIGAHDEAAALLRRG